MSVTYYPDLLNTFNAHLLSWNNDILESGTTGAPNFIILRSEINEVNTALKTCGLRSSFLLPAKSYSTGAHSHVKLIRFNTDDGSFKEWNVRTATGDTPIADREVRASVLQGMSSLLSEEEKDQHRRVLNNNGQGYPQNISLFNG